MNKDLEKLFQQKFEKRTYRSQFNTSRFTGFEIKFQETDLWIGIDPDSFNPKMKEAAYKKIESLRNKLDSYIQSEPFFKKSLKPFQPSENAPHEALEMAQAAKKAGVGPMATVAGLFAREVGNEIIQNFSVNELVIENGGDYFALLNKNLVLSVFAGDSPLSERIGLEITPEVSPLGICTSAGTVGPSLSYGKADAVVVVAKNALIADAFATSFGNKVKSPDDMERIINLTEKHPEILALLIICEDNIGIRGEFEIKILK
ncbi:MAG: UPF0280 family protein [Bacteroidota bacterium]